MSMAYIRRTYGVPAKRGARVRYTGSSGSSRTGRIVGTVASYLRVRWDDGASTAPLHPRMGVEYLDAEEIER